MTTSLKEDLFLLDEQYYGGDQAWFGNETFGIFRRKKASVGCAPIAAANIISYLFKQFNNNTKSYFMYLADVTWGYVKPSIIGFWWINRLGKRLKKFMNEKWFTDARPVKFKRPHTLENAIEYVKAGLRANCPVALAVYNSELSVGGYRLKGLFCGHWMVITSITEEDGEVTATVSSWGNKYTINFKDIMKSTLWGMVYFI